MSLYPVINFYTLTTKKGHNFDHAYTLNKRLVWPSPGGRVSLLHLAAEHLAPVPELAAPVPLVLLHLVEEDAAPGNDGAPHRVCGQRGAAKCLREADVRGHCVSCRSESSNISL